MGYYHIGMRNDDAPCEDPVWMQAEGHRLLCPKCREMRRLDALPDIPLETTCNATFTFLAHLLLGVVSVRLLEELGWEDVNRCLILGRLLDPDGTPMTRHRTYLGRHRTYFRGTPESTYRGLCATCGAPWFHASGLTRHRYLLSSRLPAAPIVESTTGELIVTQAHVERLSPALRRKLHVAPLPVIDEPRDGLGELPF